MFLLWTSSSPWAPAGNVSAALPPVTPAQALLMLAVFALVALALLVFQQRRLARRLAAADTLQALVEEIVAARSAEEIGGALMRFAGRFPGIAGLRLLAYEPESGLTPVSDEAAGEDPLPPEHPAAQRCRELAGAPEQGRNGPASGIPEPVADAERGVVFYLPVYAGGRLWGMLEIVPESGAAMARATGQHGARHLARVVGTVIAALEKAALREQAARVTAASDVTRPLQQALDGAVERLLRLRARLQTEDGAPPAQLAELRAGLDEALADLHAARDAAGRGGQALEVDLEALIGSVAARIRRELPGGRVQIETGPLQPVTVRAPLERLESLLARILQQGAQAALARGEGKIRVSLHASGSRAVVAVSCPLAEGVEPPAGPLLESLAASLGGELRTIGGPRDERVVELRLPAAGRPAPAGDERRSGAGLTILLAEPDEALRRRLLLALARRGHRVVPADLAEAADLAARFPFDCAFCSPQGDVETWQPLLERIASHTGAVAALAGVEPGRGPARVHFLRRPPSEEELDEFLAGVEPRAGASTPQDPARSGTGSPGPVQ